MGKVKCVLFIIFASLVSYHFYRSPEYPLKHKQWVPVVLWHGMGDSCCNPLSLGRFMIHLKNYLGPDETGEKIYIRSIGMGKNIVEDTFDGYFMNVNEQVEHACELIHSDVRLKNGYNAMGFSQGAQFLRAVAQRCPEPKMRNLISLGGQHQGVYGLPHCAYPDNTWCDYIRRLLDEGAYKSIIQNHLVQAEYWHDPINEQEYRNKSVFIADINNERIVNEDYIKNLQSLENLVLVMFQNDSMVVPKESAWFGFFTPGQAISITNIFDSRLYIEDRLGLKKINEAGKLHLLSVDGDHLQFKWSWFQKAIIDTFLNMSDEI